VGPLIDDAPAFTLKPRQAADRSSRHFNAQPEPESQFRGDAARIIKMVFYFQKYRIETVMSGHGEPVFDNLGKTADDVIDCPWEDVDTAHDQHVIGPTEDAALEPNPWTSASGQFFVTRPTRTHKVARSIPDYRRTSTAERCEHQLGKFTRHRRPAGIDRKKLGVKPRLNHIETVASLVTHAPRSHLCSASVIKHCGPPTLRQL
jgi:hypothetical protein